MALFHSQNKMLSERQKGRFYLHESALEVYGKDDPRKQAKEFWNTVLPHLTQEIGSVPYALGVIFAYNGEDVFDLFVPQFENIIFGWQLGPLVRAFQYHTGKLTRHPGIFPCTDAFLILAEEEKWRRKTRGLEHYLIDAPRFNSEIVKFSF
ncbi:hypothetical protein EXS74_03980 [Candidatus Woesearchaeota archaeon]|nr:hypothetical protein [Candidatus Woesearchaeota archaeon]